MKNWFYSLLATVHHVVTKPAPPRDQRGLSQSTENAILLAGAVLIAGIIITVITNYVTANLPS